MKKIFVCALASVLLCSTAALAENRSNTGCGLGTLVLGDTGFSDSTLGQSFIVTTNGTSGNQTFGITSGTSNCSSPSSFVQNEKVHEFVAANMDNLAKNIAMGKGESLDTLAELMEVPEGKRLSLYTRLQDNFAAIYPSADVQAAHVVDTVYTAATTI